MKSLTLLISLLWVIPSSAQFIEGKVQDADTSEPLIGANLYSKKDWRKGASTGIDGTFLLEGVTIGDTVIISFIGYGEHIYVVNKSAGIIISLQPNLVNMNEIVVEAEKLVAEEFSYKKLDRLDIYTNPSAKADPLLAVNSLPSSTTLDESANISFRGSGAGETGIFLNNVPVYDPVRFSQLNGIGTFGIFNNALVDEMLVFPGNPPLEYGNTTSGLVAIKTSEEIPEKAINSATISLASYGFLTRRPTGKNGALTAFTNFQPSAIITGLNREALEEIERFSSLDLGLNYIKRLNEKTLLKVFNYSITEGYDFNYVSPTFQGIFKYRKRRNYTISNFRKKLGNAEITINNNLNFSKAEFGYADTDITIHNFDAFLSANYQYQHKNHHLKTGVTFDFRRQNFDGTFYEFSYAEGPGFPTQQENSRTDLYRPEAYLYTKYYISEKLIIGGGLRKNIPTDQQKHYLSGQINTKFQISSASSVTLAWGEYNKYQLPQNDFDDSFLIKSRQLSLDFLWEGENDNSFSASLFTKKTSTDQEETNIVGSEIFYRTRITPKLSGQFSYTILEGTTVNEEGTEGPSAFDLDYFVRGNLEYRFKGYWSINSTFSFRHGSYHRPIQEVIFDEELNVYQPIFSSVDDTHRLPDYGIINLSVTRLFSVSESMNVIAFGSISNVLNKKNIRSYSYDFDYTNRTPRYFSQRTVYFGAMINF